MGIKPDALYLAVIANSSSQIIAGLDHLAPDRKPPDAVAERIREHPLDQPGDLTVRIAIVPRTSSTASSRIESSCGRPGYASPSLCEGGP